MPATQKQIAASLGVSQALVANVLNGKPGVWASAETRRKIAATARRLGYRPNRTARALVTGQTRTIAFWAAHLTTPFYASILAAFSRQAAAAGYHLLTHVSGGEPGATLDDLAGTSACDGMVAVDVLHGGNHWAAALDHDARPPLVLLGVHLPETTADTVFLDLAPGVRAGLNRLFASGCRRVAYLASRAMCRPDEVRYREYHAALERHGGVPEVVPFDGGDLHGSRSALASHLRANGRSDAVFCQNDDIAMGAYRALRDLDLRIPADVALLGCDGIDQLAYFDPAISSIRTPVEKMCATAWAFLARRMADRTLPRQSATLPARFIPRGSTRFGKKYATER